MVNSSGVIVAEGRGRRYEETGPPRQLAGTHIAHAEVNALAQLGADRHYQDHLLLTTLEPCGMCHGAAVQATVGSVAYAGSDPYGGTGDLAFGTPQARQRRLQVSGPLEDERGRLAELLHIVWILQLPAGPHVLARPAGGPAGADPAGRAPANPAPVHRRRIEPGQPRGAALRPAGHDLACRAICKCFRYHIL